MTALRASVGRVERWGLVGIPSLIPPGMATGDPIVLKNSAVHFGS